MTLELSFTAQQVTEARKLRQDGMPWEAIGRHFGRKGETVRRAVDPAYRDEMREKSRLRRRAPRTRPSPDPVPSPLCDTERSIVVMSGGMPVSLPRLKFMEANHERA